MQRRIDVHAALLADVKRTLYPAAVEVENEDTRRSAGVGAAWRGLCDRSKRELGAPLTWHVLAHAFFVAHGEAFRQRYRAGENVAALAAAETARIGDPAWLSTARESFGWRSDTGSSHGITPQAFIA
ncbi:MAG TPA: hypothetical protein VGH87_13220, partial [Polyangiaceae bacterium]